MAVEQRSWALRFGELGLKSPRVRRNFERVLRSSLERAAIRNGMDLFFERQESLMLAFSHAEPVRVEEIFRRCFGLVGADPISPMQLDPEVVAKAAVERDPKKGEYRTFAVRCKRSGAKQNWSSQEFAGEVGYHMLQMDPELKVDLSNPQITVKVHMSASQAWLMEDRIPGPGGLPCGVQGNVIAKISDRNQLLSAWQVMRRGAAIIPLPGCDEELMAILDEWDPGILEASKGNPSAARRKRQGKRTPWGFIGIMRDEAEELIRIDRDRITPAVELDATQGWNEVEKSALLEHLLDPASKPWGHAGNSNLMSWIT